MSFVINVPDNLPTNSSSSESLGPVPKGNYNVNVFDVKVEEVKSGANAGKPRWNVQLKIADGQYENRRLFVYIPLYVAGDFWKTQSFFEALGYSVKGQFQTPQPNEIMGKSLIARVTVREADGQYEADNNVAGFNLASKPESVLSSMGATAVANSPWVS
jgi:hypothetical protein